MKCRIQIRETNSNTFDSYMMVCFVFVIVGLSMVSMCITVIQGSLVCLFVVCAIFIAKWQWMEFVKNPNWIPDQVRKNPVRNKNKSPVTKISVDIPDTTAEGTGIHPVRVFWNCNGFGFGHQAAVGGSVNQIVCLVIGEENACSKIFACSKNSS